MIAVIFRPFELEDADAVVGMMQQFYAIDNYPMDVAVSKNLFLEFIENDLLGRGWVIEADGKPVGYSILTFVFSFEYGGRIAFLDELFITQALRGKGLAKQALDFITEEAKKLSVKVVYLETEPHNTAAQQLYLSKNFTLHKRGLMRLTIE